MEKSLLKTSLASEQVFSLEEKNLLNTEVHQILSHQVGSAHYSTFFKDVLVLENLQSSVAFFKVKTAFLQKIIEEKYLLVIQKSLKEVLGQDYAIQIIKTESNSANIVKLPQKVPMAKNVKEFRFSLPGKNNQAKSNEKQGVTTRKIQPSGKDFDNFIAGPANQFALNACLSIANEPSLLYPVLYLHSKPGLGKTHLMHAIALRIKQKYPQKKILFVTARNFMNEMIKSLKEQRVLEFRFKYSQADILLFDDVQELANKKGTQTEFFHLFEDFGKKKKQIILAGHYAPSELAGLEERITSRLSWGLVLDIKPPCQDMKFKILKTKAHFKNINISDDVLKLIAQSLQGSVRELEGALVRLMAHQSFFKEALTEDLVRQQLKLSFEKKDINLEFVLQKTSEYFLIPEDDIKSRSKFKSLSIARHIAMYLSYKLIETTLTKIGSFFGGRDHTSISYAIRKVEKDLKSNSQLKHHIYEIEKTLKSLS